MNLSTAFLVLAIASAIWGVIDSILIAVALDKRGLAVNMVLFRLFFFRYLSQYRQVTIQETGKTGNLFYSFIFSMILALICCIAALILRAV
jgi:hypothetical protein